MFNKITFKSDSSMFQYYEVLGFIAGTCTTFALLPQIVKVLRTRSTDDFSLGWLLMTLTGVILWIIYGLFINSQPVVLFNILSTIFISIIILFKISIKPSTLNAK